MNAIYAMLITGAIAAFGYTLTEIVRQRKRIKQLEAELARRKLSDLARSYAAGHSKLGTRC